MRRSGKRVMVHSANGHRTRKGGNSGAPPDLYTTALALHSTPIGPRPRQQLAVYKRMASRPKLRRRERFFWVCLSRVWAGWRTALVIVTPDTVVRWRRR